MILAVAAHINIYVCLTLEIYNFIYMYLPRNRRNKLHWTESLLGCCKPQYTVQRVVQDATVAPNPLSASFS